MRIEIGDSGYSNLGTPLALPRCSLVFFQSPQARGFSAFPALAQSFFLARDFLFRKHCPAAILQAAIAGRFFAYIAVKKIVVVRELFSGFNVAQGHDPYAVVDLVSLAVWITSMVHECGHAKAINNGVTVVHGEEVRHLSIRVHAFARLGREPRACIFQDERALFYGSCGVNACAVQRGRFNDDGHG